MAKQKIKIKHLFLYTFIDIFSILFHFVLLKFASFEIYIFTYVPQSIPCAPFLKLVNELLHNTTPWTFATLFSTPADCQHLSSLRLQAFIINLSHFFALIAKTNFI